MYELFLSLFAAIALVFMIGLLVAYITKSKGFRREQVGAFFALLIAGLAIFGYSNWQESNNWHYFQSNGNQLARYHKPEYAITNYEKALRFAIKEFGPRDLRVANSKLALANLYEQYGKYDEAREEYEEAIGILQENADSRSPVLKDAKARLKELSS